MHVFVHEPEDELPQSTQSVPDAQYEYSEPEPPSSHMPLEA